MAAPIDIITAALRKAFASAIDDAQPALDKAASEASTGVTGALKSTFGSGITLDDILLAIPGLGEVLTIPGNPIGAIIGKASEFVLGVASGWALGEFITRATEPLVSQIVQDIWQADPALPLDPATSARLAARGITGYQASETEASRTGINADRFGHLYYDAMNEPGVVEVLEMLKRQLIQPQDAIDALQRSAMNPKWFDALLSLQRVLLSPADLALANLRGAIGDAELGTYSQMLGVTQQDMNLLIANTGEPPGPQELLFAYRRGIIDQATLERGIRQSRVRDEWIPTIEALRFVPMSTADAVRATVENYLTDAEGQAIAEQNGLQPDHWQYLRESWGRPLAHMEMAQLVHRGLATREQFDQAMRESDMKDKYIGLSFDIATRLLSPYEIVRAIHYNAIDLQAGAKMLLQQGYSQEAVSVILKTGLHEAAGANHELTRAQITTMYSDNILTRQQAYDHLTALGYSKQDADYMLALVDTEAKLKEIKAEVSAIRLSYLAGGIDATQAENHLHAIGVDPLAAQHDISVWDREKHRAARTLTEAQTVKAAKNGTITYDAALNLLEALGYTRANANILLNSNGVTATPPAAAAA